MRSASMPLSHCLSCCGQTCECFDKMLTTRTSASSDLRMLPPSRSLSAADGWTEARVPCECTHAHGGVHAHAHAPRLLLRRYHPRPPAPPAPVIPPQLASARLSRRHVCAHMAIRLFGFARNMCASATVRRRPTCVRR
jgi:hypothetical protein